MYLPHPYSLDLLGDLSLERLCHLLAISFWMLRVITQLK